MRVGLTTMAMLAGLFPVGATMADSPPPPKPVQLCTEQWQPVCGTVSGKRLTYSNSCFAKVAGATEIAEGECGPADGGPIKPQ